MTTDPRHRISPAEVEQLLDGGGTHQGALARLLATARRPGDRGRPAPGEQAALAAFRSASGPTQIGGTPVRTSSVRRLVAVKVLAATAMVGGLGGAAVAATATGGGGERAVVLTATAPRPTAAPTPAPAARPPVTPAARARATARATTGKPDPSGNRGALVQRARLASGCVVWPHWQETLRHRAAVERRLARHGRHLPSLPVPAPVKALVAAAGSEAAVPAFCTKLVRQVCADSPFVRRAARRDLPPRHVRPFCPLRERAPAGSRG